MESSNDLESYLNSLQRSNYISWRRFSHIEMVSAKYWKNRYPWALNWRKVNDVFLLMPVVGRFEAQVEKSNSFIVEVGHVLFVPPMERHKLAIHNCDELEQISLHFHVRDPFYRNMDISYFPRHFILKNYSYWSERFMRLVHLLNVDFEEGNVFGRSMLHDYFSAEVLKLEKELVFDHVQDYRIKLLLEYINKNYMKDLNSNDMVKITNLKEVQMRRVFLKEVGISPRSYLIKFRIERACELLRSSDKSVKQISYEVGFSQNDYFQNSFKKLMRITPMEYRNNYFKKF